MANFSGQDQYVKRAELALLADSSTNIADTPGGGFIGTAAATVDTYNILDVNQTTAGQTLQIHNPTNTALENTIFINNVGSTSFVIFSTTLQPGGGLIAQWTGSAYSVIGTSAGATNVTVTGGKTFTVNNTLTLAGTDHTTATFPSTSFTAARTDDVNTFTGVQTFSSTPVFSSHVTIEGVTSTSATGTGAVVFATTPTLVTPVIGVATGTSLAVTGLISSSGTAGIGYATGAGGTVTQITSRTTGVTLSKTSGTITLVSAAGSATPFTFTVTNTLVAATDAIIVPQKSGIDAYSAVVSAVAAGSYKLTITDLTGTTTEAPTFTVVLIKGVAA